MVHEMWNSCNALLQEFHCCGHFRNKITLSSSRNLRGVKDLNLFIIYWLSPNPSRSVLVLFISYFIATFTSKDYKAELYTTDYSLPVKPMHWNKK